MITDLDMFILIIARLGKEYKNTSKVREIYAKAKASVPGEQESLLKDGFGKLRTCYEAFIIFNLLGEVIQRFEEEAIRYSNFFINIVLNDDIVKEVIERYEKLSCYIEGHLHSDTFIANKPTAQQLIDEIEAFEGLKKRHKDLLGKKKASS